MEFSDIKHINHTVEPLAPPISTIHFKNNYYIT